MKTTLHHFAFNITPGNLEFVVELFDKLGIVLDFRKEGVRWCILKQQGVSVCAQIIETDDLPIDSIERKINTHMAFLSDNPSGDIDEIEKLCQERSIEFRRGGWSEQELWFDLPGVFTNFVVEIMHTSIVK